MIILIQRNISRTDWSKNPGTFFPNRAHTKASSQHSTSFLLARSCDRPVHVVGKVSSLKSVHVLWKSVWRGSVDRIPNRAVFKTRALYLKLKLGSAQSSYILTVFRESIHLKFDRNFIKNHNNAPFRCRYWRWWNWIGLNAKWGMILKWNIILILLFRCHWIRV
jgi:hypothetical protein